MDKFIMLRVNKSRFEIAKKCLTPKPEFTIIAVCNREIYAREIMNTLNDHDKLVTEITSGKKKVIDNE